MQERDIIKYLNGTASKSEQKQMEDWVTASQENTKTFNQQKAIYVAATFNDTDQEVDIEKGYTKFASATKSKSKYYKLRPYYKYAAAASVLLIVALTIFLNKGEDTLQFTEPVIVNNQIQTGTDKATLTLEDGTDIALVKGQTYQTQNATSNGEQIIYNSSPSPKLVNNYLTTARGEQFQITLADGTQVWLNSESQLKYPVSFTGGKSRQVELVYGEAYFDVSPSTNHKGSDFKVYHKEQEVQVLGTEFNIKAYRDEVNVYTTLVEGKVSVTPSAVEGQQPTNKVLQPNQQSILNGLTNNLSVANINVKDEIAWINGEFRVQSKNLKDIMQTLSRWYDMDVAFANKDLEQVKFVGILRKDQNIIDILNMIKNFGVIKNYEINNKTITLK